MPMTAKSVDAVKEAIYASPGLRREEIVKATGLPSRTVRFALRRLRDLKEIKSIAMLTDARITRHYPVTTTVTWKAGDRQYPAVNTV